MGRSMSRALEPFSYGTRYPRYGFREARRNEWTVDRNAENDLDFCRDNATTLA